MSVEIARRDANGGRLSGCDRTHGPGTATGGAQATATRAQAHGTAAAGASSAASIAVSPHPSTSAGRTRQAANPAARWIERASMSRCERFCASCVSRRVGFMLGAAGSARVCWTIILLVRAYPRLD
jgi:hypothetical protein